MKFIIQQCKHVSYMYIAHSRYDGFDVIGIRSAQVPFPTLLPRISVPFLSKLVRSILISTRLYRLGSFPNYRTYRSLIPFNLSHPEK